SSRCTRLSPIVVSSSMMPIRPLSRGDIERLPRFDWKVYDHACADAGMFNTDMPAEAADQLAGGPKSETLPLRRRRRGGTDLIEQRGHVFGQPWPLVGNRDLQFPVGM